MAILSLCSPLQDRVDAFLHAHPDAEYVPLHPEDYASLNSGETTLSVDRPIKVLGKIGHDIKALTDKWGQEVYVMQHGYRPFTVS